MANRVQRLRHTTTALANFTGLEAEITVNLSNNSLIVHDGITPGGHEVALSSLTNVNAATTSFPGKMTDQHVRDLALALQATVQNAADIVINADNIAINLISINNIALAVAQNTADISALAGGTGNYLLLAGGTMTGVIILAADPVAAMEPSTKQYTDFGDASAESAAKSYAALLAATLEASKAARAGDTFTGPVILAADPVGPMEAATRQFVLSEIASIGGVTRTAGDIPCVFSSKEILIVRNNVLQNLFNARVSKRGIYRIKLFIRATQTNNVATTLTLRLYFNNILQGSPFVFNVPFPRFDGDTDVVVYDMPTIAETDVNMHLTCQYNQLNGGDFITLDSVSISSAQAPSHIVYTGGENIPGVEY